MPTNDQLAQRLTLSRKAGDVAALRAEADALLPPAPVSPDTFLALDALLACCLAEGHADTALRYARIKIALDSGDPFAHSLLGDILFLTGDYDRCLTAYESALRLLPEDTDDPNYFLLANDLARAYFKLGRHPECRRLCDAHSSVLESHAESHMIFLTPYVQRLLLLGDLEAEENNHPLSVEMYRKASRATTADDRTNMVADVDGSIREKLWDAVKKAVEKKEPT